MGGIVSSPDSTQLTADQCAVMLRDEFSAAEFDKMSAGQGFVTVEQIKMRRRELRGSLTENSTAKEKYCDAEGEDGDTFNLGVLTPLKTNTSLTMSNAKLSVKTEQHKEEDLASKRSHLLKLQTSIKDRKESLALATNERDTEPIATNWPDDEEQCRKEIDEISAEAQKVESDIAEIEADAWEPVVKGSKVLFYFNWATEEVQESALRPTGSPGGYARVRASFIMGSSTGSDEDTKLWAIMKNKRSSVINATNGDWRQCIDVESKTVYYTNSKTGVSQWEPPQNWKSDKKTASAHGLQRGAAEEDEVGEYEEEGEKQAEEHSGWEAITSPDGDILYYYNYTTGDWTGECPDEWDRESYQVEQAEWGGGGGGGGEGGSWQANYEENEAKLRKELENLVDEEKNNVAAVQELVSGLKELLSSAQLQGGGSWGEGDLSQAAFPITHATAVPQGVYLCDDSDSAAKAKMAKNAPKGSSDYLDLFSLDPKVLVDKLESEHSNLLESTNTRDYVEELKKKVNKQDVLSHRRTTMRKPGAASVSPALSPVRPSVRRKTRQLSTGTEFDVHMWRLLISGSKVIEELASGAKMYRHERSGRVFKFDEVEGGSFEPQPSSQPIASAIGTVVMHI